MANASQLFESDEEESQGQAPAGNTPDDKFAQPASRGLFNPHGDSKSNVAGGGGRLGGTDKAGKTATSGMFQAAKGAAEAGAPEAVPAIMAAEKLQQANSKRKNKAQGQAKKPGKNKLLFAGIGGGLVVIAGIIILILLVGSLKLPDVAQSIENYEFAESVIQFSNSARRVTDEELAVEAADDGTFAALKGKYGALRDGTWGRLDSYRPSQVIANLGDDNGLQLRFKTSLTGRQIFIGGTINGNDFDVQQVTGLAKWTPGVSKIVKFKNNISFLQSDFFPQLMDTMKANNIRPLIRGLVFLDILHESGGSLAGWTLSKFTGKSGEAADVEATQEMYKATEDSNPTPTPAATEQIAEADAAAQQQTAADAADPTKVAGIIQNGGDDAAALKAADGQLSNKLTTALSIGDIIYGIAVPICTIFDGSVQQSGSTIDYQMHQQQDASDQLLAEADQQKNGDVSKQDGQALAAAVQGTNDEIGDISQSIPYQRAYGVQQATIGIVGAEAGSDGSYTYSLIDALGVPPGSIVATSANAITSNLCSILTNGYVAGATAIANIIATIISFGGTEAGTEAAGQGARVFITKFISETVADALATKVITKGVTVIERTALSRGLRFAFKQGLVIGGTYGLSEVAHLIVAARAGQSNNGLAQNTDLVNEADSGANINNGELERQMMFARPLMPAEVAQEQHDGITELSEINASQSFTQRYFALTNADSLLTHVGMDLGAGVHSNLLASLAKLGTTILKPMGLLGSLVSSLGGAKVAAAPDPISLDYGNVQFGWTPAEEALIDSSDTYKMLENQQILDASGNEVAIAQKYGICFGYAYNASGDGNLDPSDPNSDLQLTSAGTVGSLLSAADIQRDDKGNVITEGLCNPINLGNDNTSDSLAADSKGPQRNDMIFRFRLAMRYDNTTDQLANESNVTN